MRSSSEYKKRFVENVPRLVFWARVCIVHLLLSVLIPYLFILVWRMHVFCWVITAYVQRGLRALRARPASQSEAAIFLIDEMQWRRRIPPQIVNFKYGNTKWIDNDTFTFLQKVLSNCFGADLKCFWLAIKQSKNIYYKSCIEKLNNRILSTFPHPCFSSYYTNCYHIVFI